MPALKANAVVLIDSVIALRDDLDEPTKKRIRAAAMRAARDRKRAGTPLSRQDREDFLSLLASGISIDDAAEVVDRNISVLYNARKALPEFDRAWADALEVGCSPVERRLQSIALDGDAGSMATVRAAEVLLKTRHRAHQQAKSPSMSATVEGPNGGALTVRIGTPGPD